MSQQSRSFFPMLTRATLDNVVAARRRGASQHIIADARANEPQPEPEKSALMRLDPDELMRLIQAAFNMGELVTFPFKANILPVQIRPAEPRLYFMIQNQSTANQIAVGFGKPPTGLLAAPPIDGVILPTATANSFGVYEPILKPCNTIWVASDANNVPGSIVMAFPGGNKDLLRKIFP